MAYRNLDEFLTRLEQAGDVARFSINQSNFDTPEIDAQDANKVHLFTDSTGIRIVRNLFGTSQRVEQALRLASLDLIAERLEQLLEIGKPGALGAMISRAMTMFSAIRTTTNRRAPNEYQMLSFADWRKGLDQAPTTLRSHAIQATLLTSGETPRMSSVSVLLNDNEIVGEFWPDLPLGETIALVVGGDPAFILASHAPLPDIIHRSYFASWLRDKPLDMMRLSALNMEVPSNAETVIAAMVKEQSGDHTMLDVSSVWTKPSAIFLQMLPAEHLQLRDAFVEIMSPLIRRFLPGVQRIQLRNQLGILTIDPLNTDRELVLRQLWAIPIFANIYYWLLLPELDDIDGAVVQLMLEDINTFSRLMHGKANLGVLLDASSKRDTRESSEPDVELEQVFWHFKRNWQHDTPSGES